jgi:hypothetical protein
MKKKVVIALVVIAIILAAISISYSFFNIGEKISTKSPDDVKVEGSGKIGVVVIPPQLEDKGEPVG